jgi:hypothetical protein
LRVFIGFPFGLNALPAGWHTAFAKKMEIAGPKLSPRAERQGEDRCLTAG